MAFVAPRYSRARVDRAGHAHRDGAAEFEDHLVLENWRASHLYIINTFQANLRARRKSFDGRLTIAQRLKRRPTIMDKLRREPDMSLSRMHDIAGCRLIFEDISKLRDFRRQFHQSRARHELVGDDDRYDYIISPKSSGYRGVHDVYKYVAYAATGRTWNNLRIELQYRTIVQHAWATAVEIVDMVVATRLKFSEADDGITRQFLVASELLARAHEDVPGFCASVKTSELIEEFKEIEGKHHYIARLRELSSSEFGHFARTSKLFVLVNYFDPGQAVYAEGYADNRSAVAAYERLEQQYQGKADVVLVGASEQDAVKLAYTNYFSDASIFLKLLDEACERFGEKQQIGPRPRSTS